MAELRALFEDLGFTDVRTLLNSGNVVFSAGGNRRGDLAARIEKELVARLRLNVSVIILSSDDIIAAVKGNPFGKIARDLSRLLVVVPKEAADLARLAPVLKEKWAPERLAIGRRVAYMWCANGVGESVLWPKVDRALAGSCTARNMATMTKIMGLIEATPPA